MLFFFLSQAKVKFLVLGLRLEFDKKPQLRDSFKFYYPTSKNLQIKRYMHLEGKIISSSCGGGASLAPSPYMGLREGFINTSLVEIITAKNQFKNQKEKNLTRKGSLKCPTILQTFNPILKNGVLFGRAIVEDWGGRGLKTSSWR